MAKVVVDNRNVVAPWRSKLPLIGISAGAGLSWWALTGLITKYVIEPLACRDAATLTTCGDAPAIAGSVAAILVAIVALLAFAALRFPRPLFIAAGAAGLLWSLGLYTAGMIWWEALLWSVALYTLAYVLFSLVARIRAFWMSLTVLLVLIAAMRLLVAF